MKYINKIILVVAVFTVMFACSTKKDTLINRNYHALTTKYNVLFNGKEAFKDGIEAINNGYKDDYFKQLPIEPIEFEEDRIVIPTYSNLGMGAGFDDEKKEDKKQATSFDLAEEKAVKAIQKHGMKIDGLERNSQIDDAYLLLGKSRYYLQRFIPAIEAFNYVIANYPNASLIAETKIWRAKTNIRLDNEEFAIESMNLLLNVKDTLEADLPDEIKEQGHTALAMAYVKADSISKVKKHLHLATRTLENREQGARNLFILGQIYASENKKDSAIIVFNKLANFKKAPYKFRIHATIEIAKNATKDSTTTALIEKMQKLIKDRDNRPYLDELYYQVGFLHEKNDSISKALEYYNKSLLAKNGSDQQKSFTYEKLGNLYFKNDHYLNASAYYDSVLQVSTDKKELRVRRIKRKHKNLASLIKFENLVAENDSIIRIASLSKNEQEIFFQKYIDDLKKKDEELAQLRLNQLAFGGDFGGGLQSNKQGAWYFYNNQSLGFGKTEFQKIWGNRKLEDDWRWASKIKINTNTTDSLQVNAKDLRYDLASYLASIPTKKDAIDSLKINRNQALFELGIIYKEQFKNPKLAIERLTRVASLNLQESLILPINWHLYQVYKCLGEELNKNKYKDIILTKYPNTVFAKIIKTPNKKVIEEKVVTNKVENKYKEIYYLYKENKFEETVKEIHSFLPSIQNSTLIAKFELLKAYAIGKYTDTKTYKIALEAVAIKYANTKEGKKAQEIIKQLSK